MADDAFDELTERFGGGKPLHPDVVATLRSIMRLYELSVEDMWFKWDAYCIKLDTDGTNASLEALHAFKQDLQDQLERSNRTQVQVKTEKRVGATPRTVAKSNTDYMNMLDGMTTPAAGRSARVTSARKRQLETPSVSRVKAEPMSSPLKLEDRLNDLGAIPYVVYYEVEETDG